MASKCCRINTPKTDPSLHVEECELHSSKNLWIWFSCHSIPKLKGKRFIKMYHFHVAFHYTYTLI